MPYIWYIIMRRCCQKRIPILNHYVNKIFISLMRKCVKWMKWQITSNAKRKRIWSGRYNRESKFDNKSRENGTVCEMIWLCQQWNRSCVDEGHLWASISELCLIISSVSCLNLSNAHALHPNKYIQLLWMLTFFYRMATAILWGPFNETIIITKNNSIFPHIVMHYAI